MAWNGYFSFAGSEIINTERVEAYLADNDQSWFRPIYGSTSMGVIEDETYESPWVDPAPWGDPDNPDTYRFWGVYPLNITGLDDDTRQATVTENVGDGGWIGPVRKATRSGVFEVLLLGAEECAVDAGFRWLKSALTPSACAEDGCNGSDLCYFTCEPCIGDSCTSDEVTSCVAEKIRTLRNVKVVSGPTITAKRTMSDGAVAWVATFTIVAGVPFAFGSEVQLVEGFMTASDPWVPEIVPVDWNYSVSPSTKADAVCAEPAYQPIVDPECPAVLVPPGPPSVKIGCFTAPEEWERRWFTIPRKYIPYWGDTVPVVRVQAVTDVRNLRLRFYADVDADASVKDDPCSYCGDILFSYIPADHTLVLDGITQTVYAEGPGGTLRRADSLVFKTDGTPFEWPVLSCGFGYVVTVDLPPDFDGSLPGVDLSVTTRAS